MSNLPSNDKRIILASNGLERSSKPMSELVRSIPRTSAIHRGLGKGISRTGSFANVTMSAPEIRNPLLNIINFYLPQNYKVLNQWIRYYYTFNELIGNCIDAHAEYPISPFHFDGIDDPKILAKYEALSEDLDLFNIILGMSFEYELIGEVYPFAHWSKDLNRWDNITILNPDYVLINEAYLAYKNKIKVELEPDEETKRLVHSTDPRDLELRQGLDPMIIRAVEEGTNIPIDSFSIAQIARKGSLYEPRGKSVVLRALKTLLYDDKLIELQQAIADNMITPRQIWKLGDPQNDYMPGDEEIEDFRSLLDRLKGDPNAQIVTHYGLNLELVGYNGKIQPIIQERQYNEERILMAMYTNKSVLKGEGPGFSSGPQVAFQYLQGRYMSKRQKIVSYLMNKIFVPFAVANGFWKKGAHGEKELILPEFVWDQKLDLVEDNQKRQYLSQLRDRLQVSARTLYETFGIDYKTETRRLKEEEGTTVDPIEIEKRKKKGAAESAEEVTQKLPGAQNDSEVQQEVVKQVLTPSKEPSKSSGGYPKDSNPGVKAPSAHSKVGSKTLTLKRATIFVDER